MRYSILTAVPFLIMPVFLWSQSQGYLQMDIMGPIHYVVTDSMGRRTGFDPRIDGDYSEIPNMGYGLSGADSHDPDTEPLNFWEFGFNTNVKDPTFHEQFTVTVIGIHRGVFSGIVGWSVDPGKGGSAKIQGLVDSNQTSSFTFSISMDTSRVFEYSKVVAASSLRQDLDNSYDLNLLGNRSLYKKWGQQVERIENQLERKDPSKAYEELERFAKELKNVREETEKHEERKRKPNQFVTSEAFDILSEDVAILMSPLSPRKHHKEDDDRRDRQKDDGGGDKKKSDHDKH